MMEIVKFVCFKVSRLSLFSHASCREPLLITGSWDEMSNRLCIWKYIGENTWQDLSLLSSIRFDGDVMDIKCSSIYNYIAVGSSTGALILYKLEPTSLSDTMDCWEQRPMLSEIATWPSGSGGMLSRSCNCIALKDAHSVVVGGEDGAIRLLSLNRAPSDTIGVCESIVSSGSDCCSVNGVEFIDQTNFASVNSAGHLKVWDIRKSLKQPERSILVGNEPIALHSLARHPGQSHLVAAGAARGILFLWDLRQERYPLAEVASQGGNLWQVKFHPSQPQHVYLASELGGLIRVSTKMNDASWAMNNEPSRKLAQCSLLPCDASLGVNSLDVTEDMVVAGTDDEILYSLPHKF